MLYEILLALHSWNRWLVLVAGLLAVITAVVAWKHGGGLSPANRVTTLSYVILTDIQLLLGLGLYMVTPWLPLFLDAPGEAMANAPVRYWNVEHVGMMILAVVLVHVGWVMVKKSAKAPRKIKTATVLLVLALVLMLVSTPWPFLSQARPLFRI